MIIHSIILPEDIFPVQCACSESQLVPIRHGYIELDGKRAIKRVISTDPQDYLDKSYQLDKYLP